ncbi:hypothetical protein ACFQ6N_29505 [Kitasatospora sp. NPDC056446]|uniref:hypothetical protein n=1 Tax=Kitasatospora sp. NPDC056446 TaxID=3345819 RepID=UPI0036855047
MIIVLGLLLLVAAAVIAVAAVVGNAGSGHALTNAFTVFGQHVHGSTGTLFLYGLAVGAVGVLGLGLLLAGARRGATARHALRRSREPAAESRRRDEAVDQHDSARVDAASAVQDREDRLAAQRDTLARERDDLARIQERTREHTAGTRLNPMARGEGEDAPAALGKGHHRPHLLLGRGTGRR